MKQVGVLALQGAFIEHEKMLEQLGVSCIELRNKEDLEKCVNSKETHRVIAQQKKLGVQIGVKGTPAIYVNGRRLSGGQNLPLLKAAYSEL